MSIPTFKKRQRTFNRRDSGAVLSEIFASCLLSTYISLHGVAAEAALRDKYYLRRSSSGYKYHTRNL